MANFANVFAECIGHPMLMCSWGITATLWHDSPLIEAPWCPYGGEVNVIGVHSGLDEGIGHVHFGEHLSLPAVSKDIIDAGEGEAVPHGVAIECSIVIYLARGNRQVGYSCYVFWYTECQ